MDIKAGLRLRSAVDDTEVIVVKSAEDSVDIRCGGHEMLPMDAVRPDGLAAQGGFDTGTALGKRYTDEASTLELLCTKGGPSSLSVGETPLQLKDAKPLPSSD
jgi:hypothetical protein